jgi:hypothetical protein
MLGENLQHQAVGMWLITESRGGSAIRADQGMLFGQDSRYGLGKL